MMSLATINALATDQGQKARRLELEPHYITFAEDIDDYPPFPFPNIGDYVPKGFKEIDTAFVDSSGFGESGEPALTVDQLKKWLEPGYWYAITEEGQFQVYISKFTYEVKKGA